MRALVVSPLHRVRFNVRLPVFCITCLVLMHRPDGSRTITVPVVNQATRTAHILELDSNKFNLGLPGGAWPEGLPHIDGVLVCYDASDMASFARVPDLLGTFRS